MLLLRALVARFWSAPYRERLVRWGTRLHDEFMLPHFVAQDMRDVVDDLNRAGYAFDTSWFAPFLEFRFPRYGTVSYDGIELELRQAIEPWHVLGEEVSAAGTSRYVDSSVERLQVKATRPQRRALRRRLQRPRAADDADRRARANSSPACATARGPALGAASDHRRARAAGVRPRRHLERALARRLHLPRGAPGRPQLRRPSR